MAEKKDEKVEVKEEPVKEEPKKTEKKKDIKKIHIENRLAAINRVSDRDKARAMAETLFRKGK